MTHDALDATTLHRLHDLAKVEAQRLRLEAMRDFGRDAVDDFWRGADAVYQRCLDTNQTLAERGATRLQARLARRARGRLPSSCPVTTGA